MKRLLPLLFFVLFTATATARNVLKNDRYTLTADASGNILVETAGAPAQTLRAEFTVMHSARDPEIDSNHNNYLLAPRMAVLWRAYEEDAATLNARLNTPAARADYTYPVNITGAGARRVWTWYRDAAKNSTRLKVTGARAAGTTNPFLAGERHTFAATGATISGGQSPAPAGAQGSPSPAAAKNKLAWTFAAERSQPFTFAAELELPPGDAAPRITFRFTARKSGWYSAAFTGAPALPIAKARRVDQEVASNFRIFNYVIGENTIHLPHVYLNSADGWASALAIDPVNSPFADPATGAPRVPYRFDAYCGAYLRKDYDAGVYQPVVFAPLMGGADSQMKSGDTRTTVTHYILSPGDWKGVYREVAQKIYGNTDRRDNTGTGSLNRTLDRIVDFLANRNGQNHALWHDEQKYYDYVNDLPGAFKPFSPLFGLGLAIAFDDENFYRTRVRPQLEFGLSRDANYFTPYDFDKSSKMISVVNRRLGASYLTYVQLVSLHGMLQNRNQAPLRYAEQKGAGEKVFPEMLAKYSLTQNPADLDAALADARADIKSDPLGSRAHFMDWLDIWEASGATPAGRDPAFLSAAVERVYNKIISTVTLAPAVPGKNHTLDIGGRAPVHLHSFGRHIRWGFPKPLGYPTPEQTVPAWRGSLNGLQGLGPYRGEFWIDNHSHFMRIGAAARDDFLRDVARLGIVGRFAHYPGDNRSAISLVTERPELAENPLWKMTHATYNPGHAWEFGAAVLDYMVADVFQRSRGAIDFPSRSMHGATFRVRLQGDRPGTFYGDTGVRLWMPRCLAIADSPHIDYISAYGNGKLYFAFVNQSAEPQTVRVIVDPERADFKEPRNVTWRVNNSPRPVRGTVSGNQLRFAVPAKGITACVIDDVKIQLGLHAKLFAPDAPALGAGSFRRDDLKPAAPAPATHVTAMLFTAGKGLTHAFIYSGAQAADTQLARLRYRQGAGAPWLEKTDAIFPYEFSADYREGAGDFEYIYTLVTAAGEECSTPPLKLVAEKTASDAAPAHTAIAPAPPAAPAAAPSSALQPFSPSAFIPAARATWKPSGDFLNYMKEVTNPPGDYDFGQRDGRWYPYSTPYGRRIAYALPVRGTEDYVKGISESEAVDRLSKALSQAALELSAHIAARRPGKSFESLRGEMQEVLVDHAFTEGAANVPDALIDAAFAPDAWDRIVGDMLYARIHDGLHQFLKNKAFFNRWLKPRGL